MPATVIWLNCQRMIFWVEERFKSRSWGLRIFSNTPPEYYGKAEFLIDEGNTSIAAITATDIDGHSLSYSIIGGEDQFHDFG